MPISLFSLGRGGTRPSLKPNRTVLLNNFQRKQTCPRAGAADAEAGVGFVDCAVGLADEGFAFGIKETVVAVIQCERNVTAGVFVGEEFAFEAADEPFLRAVIAREGKRDSFPLLEFFCCCNANTRHGGRVTGIVSGRKLIGRDARERVSPAVFSFALHQSCHTWRMKLFVVFVGLAISVSAAPKGWPKEIREIKYLSKVDNSKQPALFFAPTVRGEPRPLLVGLHSWSSDYRQNNSPYATWCIEHKWNFIHPNFRGPNRQPQATGSERVVADILSAVEYAKQNAAVDETRIYLLGASGGGYAALLMAGRAPEVWAGISAWVPISDLTKWYAETSKRKLKYSRDIELSLGGKPLLGTKAEAEARKRSPITYLARAKGVALDINAGITDGHNGSVPISHSLEAFNLLAAAKDRLTAKQISEFVRTAKVPQSITDAVLVDKTYGAKRVLFRRQSGTARVTIFQGGHEIIPAAALHWLGKQQRMRAPKNE